jgi:acetyltransferase-like isoleucine patch superfamily enzyme
MATERSGYEKMRAGEPYACPDWDIVAMQAAAAEELSRYNAEKDVPRRMAMLADMLGSVGSAFVMSPVTWEFGKHIHLGKAVFINFDCVFLDGADITIGDGTVVAPKVQFLTAGHPVDPRERVIFDIESGERVGGYSINRPIVIGKDCWIGAGALIMGGVTIGDGTTIGAGSVVTKDIPDNVVAAGNPCRIIRSALRPDHAAANAA